MGRARGPHVLLTPLQKPSFSLKKREQESTPEKPNQSQAHPRTLTPPYSPPPSPGPHRSTMAACQWHKHIPNGEQPRGADAGTVVREGTGWRCRHSARPGSELCTVHEQADLRRGLILDWAVYELSRRRDSFAGHAYDWAMRKEVARLPLDRLRAALDLIIEDRARDGAKRGIVEVSDLVRAVASVQRERKREKRQASSCPTCFGSGWRVVFDRYMPGMSGAVACECSDGGSRSSEAQERGRPVCNVDSMPRRWSTEPPQPVAGFDS